MATTTQAQPNQLLRELELPGQRADQKYTGQEARERNLAEGAFAGLADGATVTPASFGGGASSSGIELVKSRKPGGGNKAPDKDKPADKPGTDLDTPSGKNPDTTPNRGKGRTDEDSGTNRRGGGLGGKLGGLGDMVGGLFGGNSNGSGVKVTWESPFGLVNELMSTAQGVDGGPEAPAFGVPSAGHKIAKHR